MINSWFAPKLTEVGNICLFLAIPYGYLADKHGRKWLMVLNSASITLRFLWMYIVCKFVELKLWFPHANHCVPTRRISRYPIHSADLAGECLLYLRRRNRGYCSSAVHHSF